MEQSSKTHVVHGIALVIYGSGIIITGDSGSGKTDLGLDLVSRGHKFIADDTINITIKSGKLHIYNQLNQAIMHIRGIGFIDIRQTFGHQQIINENPLHFIIHLDNTDFGTLDPLAQSKTKLSILDQSIDQFTLPIGNGRPLATLVEVLVKYQQQLINHIDSHYEFINHHNQLLQEDNLCSLS